jgi:dipeptidase E
MRPWEEFEAMVRDVLPLDFGPLEEAEVVVVGGGNTFQLLAECRRRGLLQKIRTKKKYIGWSAGANLACPTIRTTNDMPIVDPGGLDALGLVPFQINPHYLSTALPGPFGETRDQRLAEFARANPRLPVIGLPEGDWLTVSGAQVQLNGPHPAVLFSAAQRSVLAPGKLSL